MKQTTRFGLTFTMENNELKQSREESSTTEAAVASVALAQQAAEDPDVSTETQETLQQLVGELEQLVGLTKVKDLVKEISAYVEICRRREKFQLKNDSLVLHMIFKGNPGTGKTTVARILGRMLVELKVLPKGHLIEVERADLVGEYIGHTAQKCREQVKKAIGGILFIDEAYALARGGEKDFGKEAIDTLVKSMEDHKNELILILAGYEKEMEKFLRTNPGLRSRFPIHLQFTDYTCEELLEIAQLMVREREYQISVGAAEHLHSYLQAQLDTKSANFSNARLVRNLIEKAIRCQALRLVKRRLYSRDELMMLIREDFEQLGQEDVDFKFWQA
ncbi:MAG: AAA family ATPase [Firmicutes bacterium]|nr:AAA family ATPase [Bacillota bacterium]